MESGIEGQLPAAGLWVVATPIGNLGDLSPRAQSVLAAVDVILAEDTRHTRGLLTHFGISRPLKSLHAHNEAGQVEHWLSELGKGRRLALVSDAGTPLLSDPGFPLVQAARAAGFAVIAIPGPSAITAALSAAGLPVDRFCFEGFPPVKTNALKEWAGQRGESSATQVIFEAPHRILNLLEALVSCWGGERPAWLVRELSKRHEDWLGADLASILASLREHPERCRGEMVLIVSGVSRAATDRRRDASIDEFLDQGASALELRALCRGLAEDVEPSRLARRLADWSGLPRRQWYDWLQEKN